MATARERKTIGIFQRVSFPSFKMADVQAKVDTGAYTGALHCTKVEEIETPGGKILHFSPFDQPEIVITATEFTRGYVRSSNGKQEKRYFIATDITVAEKTYPIVLSLADRTRMKWPVLIGRRFLRANHFVVDARRRGKYRKPV